MADEIIQAAIIKYNNNKKPNFEVIDGTYSDFTPIEDDTFPIIDINLETVYKVEGTGETAKVIRGSSKSFKMNPYISKDNVPEIFPDTVQIINFELEEDLIEKLVKESIDKNLYAYFKEEKEKLQTYLTFAADAMLSILLTENKNNKVNKYSEIINKYINDPELITSKRTKKTNTNPDGPMFLDFVYGYRTNNGKKDYSYQPREMNKINDNNNFLIYKTINNKSIQKQKKPTNNYNKNIGGLIACCAYIEYKTETLHPNRIKNYATIIATTIATVKNIEQIKDEKLMCIFAHLTSKVFELANCKIDLERCDMRIPISDLINSNDNNGQKTCNITAKFTFRNYVCQIYAAAIVLSGIPIPTDVEFCNYQDSYNDLGHMSLLQSFFISNFKTELTVDDFKQKILKEFIETNGQPIIIDYNSLITDIPNLIKTHNKYVQYYKHKTIIQMIKKDERYYDDMLYRKTTNYYYAETGDYFSFKNNKYYEHMISKLNENLKTKLKELKDYQQPAAEKKQAKQKGGKSRNLLKVSDKRVMINGRSRVVYVSARNVEYILRNGEFVKINTKNF